MPETSPAIFFDDGKGAIAPLCDLRPVFDVRTGALTTFDRLTRALALDPVAMFVHPDIAGIAAERGDLPINRVPDLDRPILLINGRCPLPLDVISGLEPGRVVVEDASGDLIAARVESDAARAVLAGEPEKLDVIRVHDHVLISRPWHVRTFRDPCMEIDLKLLLADARGPEPTGCCLIGGHPLHVAPDARVYPACVLDTEQGPIVIGPGATVRPRATIIGPAWIGPGSTVLDGALIKPNTAIGPVCKVAGEVGGTIFQGYSNKGHDGHLGDSWIGQWVNLGAGTTNSNLLNTYGEITAVAEPGSPRERTGQTFFGCVLGDHVKTAICTRIMTGAIVHTGAMWAASRPISGCVGRFAWATDAGTKAYRIDRFLAVMKTAMERRKIEPSKTYTAAIERLGPQ